MIAIATHGSLRWESESDVAGPYYLTNGFMIFVTFGTRTLGAERPGSIGQREIFEQSRAAFNAIRTMTDATRDAAELRRLSKIAAASARSELSRWGMSGLISSECLANFQRDVDRRFAKEVLHAS